MISRLVSTDWLASNLSKIRLLDASWLMPNSNISAHAEYLSKHIPTALFFDIDKIADTDSSLPHMLPSSDKFSKLIGEMGISNNDHVVVYGTRVSNAKILGTRSDLLHERTGLFAHSAMKE
jgi:thiosulfate/3-mercaptopyruvate sulfurtransferase